MSSSGSFHPVVPQITDPELAPSSPYVARPYNGGPHHPGYGPQMGAYPPNAMAGYPRGGYPDPGVYKGHYPAPHQAPHPPQHAQAYAAATPQTMEEGGAQPTQASAKGSFFQEHKFAIIIAVIILLIVIVIIYMYMSRRSDKKKKAIEEEGPGDPGATTPEGTDQEELKRLRDMRRAAKGAAAAAAGGAGGAGAAGGATPTPAPMAAPAPAPMAAPAAHAAPAHAAHMTGPPTHAQPPQQAAYIQQSQQAGAPRRGQAAPAAAAQRPARQTPAAAATAPQQRPAVPQQRPAAATPMAPPQHAPAPEEQQVDEDMDALVNSLTDEARASEAND